MNQDQIKGRMDQAKGKIKQVTGKLLGDSHLESEGKLNQSVGQVQASLGDLKERAKNSLQSLVK
ncbi:MAG: CsbD family protein [Burkholderiaceae bacterium]